LLQRSVDDKKHRAGRKTLDSALERSQIMAALSDVRTHAFFLPRDDLYDSVKPYILEDASNSIPRSNSHSQRVDNVLFRDLRGKEESITFATSGFGVLHHETSLSYNDFFNPELVYGVYCREIASCMLQYTGGCHVQIFDVNVSEVTVI
jgi:hypothetical protein